MKVSTEKIPDHADIILFGPSGSGKSSLIRTFYRALHDTQEVPEKVAQSLSIKQKDQNEGTTQFTAVVVKKKTKIMTREEAKTFRLKQNQNPLEEESELDPVVKKKGKKDKRKEGYTSAIVVHDTRGQIWMDNKEMEQLTLLMKGKVKDKTMVEQRNYRYAYLLWEFWKRD